MATNDFLTFCPNDSGTNLPTQSVYSASTTRTSGNQPGIASSQINNKAIRQANVISSQFAQAVSDLTGNDMLDDGDLTAILASIKEAISSGVPIGTIISAGFATAPAGYLFCDGSVVSRTTYANLFAAIGVGFGNPSGTTFNLPDLRGRFLRGQDDSAGRDPDASSRTAMNTGGNTGDAVGSIQGSVYTSHIHTDSGHTHTTVTTNFNPAGGGGSFSALTNNPAGAADPVIISNGHASIVASGGNETRPINAYVNYFIKF